MLAIIYRWIARSGKVDACLLRCRVPGRCMFLSRRSSRFQSVGRATTSLATSVRTAVWTIPHQQKSLGWMRLKGERRRGTLHTMIHE